MCFLRKQATNNGGYFAASLVLFIVALLCHETAVAFPFYLGCALFLVRRESLKRTFLACLPFFIILILYFGFRQIYAVFSINLSERLAFIGISFTEYLAAFARCVGWYVKALIFLEDIVLMWSPSDLESAPLFWTLGLGGGLATAVYIIILFRRDGRAFGLGWFLAGLMPVGLACLSRPGFGVIIEPHWLFFSTIGYCVLAAGIVLRIFDRLNKGLGIAVVILLLAGFSLATLRYNSLWADEKKYCRYMLTVSPTIPLTAFWLADAYMQEGDWENAKRYYLSSVRGYKSDWEAYTNVGLIEDIQGNFTEAKDYYRKALFLEPEASIPQNNLAAQYIEEKKYQAAEQLLIEISQKHYYYTAAKKNLAVLYLNQGLKAKAAEMIKMIIQINPQDADIPSLIRKLNERAE
jgi:tetratricopeptide (TPR) repeat protein